MKKENIIDSAYSEWIQSANELTIARVNLMREVVGVDEDRKLYALFELYNNDERVRNICEAYIVTLKNCEKAQKRYFEIVKLVNEYDKAN